MKVKTIIFSSILLISLGAFIAINFINKKEEKKFVSFQGPIAGEQIADLKEVLKKLKLQEVTIEKFKQSQELIVMEVELSETIIWDESWGELSVFRKSQEVNFYGTGIYTTDLALIEPEDIKFEHNEKKIYVNAVKPQIKSIELDEDKTTYTVTDTGFFRFGDIKITPAQSQMVNQQVKAQMKEQMNKIEFYNQALTSAELSIEDLFKKIISNTDMSDYDILIIWE